MQPDSTGRDTARAALRARVAALHARPCGMVHERVSLGPDGLPLRDALSASGYHRPGICAAAVRNGHLGCSHTAARLVLRQALGTLGEEAGPLGAAFETLDGALGTIDHRRYEAESRRADALHAGDGDAAAAAEAAIQAIVAEHRALGLRVGAIRDAILLRLDPAP